MAATERPRILIVEDDLGLQKQLKWCLDEYEVICATTRAEAIAHLRRFEPAVVLQDLGLPPDPEGVTEGMQSLTEILSLAPFTKVIVITGKSERQNAVAAVSAGAYDFYQKPIDDVVLKLVVERAFRINELETENRRLAEAATSTPFAGFVATDEAMLKVCRTIDKVAPTNVSVLILGESGTGKELLARALHAKSDRSKGKFVPINCAAIPEHLLESELFGHEKGAFTGAVKQTIGKIELASGGTLFLDEIGDMPMLLQAKLLRFLQDRVIERIGGREEILVNVRVVCATNHDPKTLISQQRFREDLYFRIGEVVVTIPPLRIRIGGPTVLAYAMLQKHSVGLASSGLAKGKRGFTPEALASLESYQWPGNVRELENKVKTALIMADGPLLTPEDLGLEDTVAGESVLNLRQVRSRAERQAIVSALTVADGNMSKCAELLGISRPTLYDLMEKNDIHAPE